jgi:hypothetical protein
MRLPTCIGAGAALPSAVANEGSWISRSCDAVLRKLRQEAEAVASEFALAVRMRFQQRGSEYPPQWCTEKIFAATYLPLPAPFICDAAHGKSDAPLSWKVSL